MIRNSPRARRWMLFAVWCLAGEALQGADPPPGYKLVYEQNFEKAGAMQDFVFSDPVVWRISSKEGNTSLELFGQSKYTPKHRSPFNIALLADKAFRSEERRVGKEYRTRRARWMDKKNDRT